MRSSKTRVRRMYLALYETGAEMSVFDFLSAIKLSIG